MAMRKRIAVVLCGSGFKDGSEIRESVGVLWALSQHPVDVQCFAPDAPQKDVINCLTGQAMNESRNQLVEAARIARGKIKALTELNPSEFDALILPGGFGAAKNLCDFASKGIEGSVIPELKEKLQVFHSANKPIGAVCIAPAIVTLAFPNMKFNLTVGSDGGVAESIEKLGHNHIITSASECCSDKKNKIFTTPAYMYDNANLSDIFEGIRKLVSEVTNAFKK
ncbi:MAG: isoprenoid biosynthesis glyoxalase ElbB [bacterium]